MLKKNKKRFSPSFMIEPTFRSYKIEYVLESQHTALISFLAKKAGLSDDNFTNELNELRSKGYQPPNGTSIFDVHYWTEYVDLSTGLIIGWDNNTKTIGEHFNHHSYLLFDKESNSAPTLSEKSIFNAEFNVGIHEITFGHTFSSKETLFRFKPFEFTLELMRLEASQSGMHKYLFKEMPPHWLEMFNNCGVKYTSWHFGNDSIRQDLQEMQCDYDYEFKNEGLTFYDQTTDEHTFVNDLFSLRYSIEFHEPLIHLGYIFGK